MRICHSKVADEIKTHIMFSNFFWKSCGLWDNVEKYGRARQATGDNIIWFRRGVIWVMDN